jgi:hypothetical protein
MISRILPLLNRLIPQGIAMKGLSKLNPRIGSFLTNATAAGYSANEVMDFLRQQTGIESSEGLRPDEAAAATRVQQGKAIPRAIGTAAKVGLGASGIAAIPEVIGNMFQGQGQEQQGEQQEQGNIIQQLSPELFSFIENLLQQGRSIDEAGALAQNDSRFSSIISKLQKSANAKWSDILSSVFGGSQQQAQQPQSSSNADAAIMAALEKILKM